MRTGRKAAVGWALVAVLAGGIAVVSPAQAAVRTSVSAEDGPSIPAQYRPVAKAARDQVLAQYKAQLDDAKAKLAAAKAAEQDAKAKRLAAVQAVKDAKAAVQAWKVAHPGEQAPASDLAALRQARDDAKAAHEAAKTARAAAKQALLDLKSLQAEVRAKANAAALAAVQAAQASG